MRLDKLREAPTEGRFRKLLMAALAATAVSATACNGDSNNNNQPDGGAGAAGAAGEGGTAGSGGAGGENPCADLKFEGLASMRLDPGQTDSTTVNLGDAHPQKAYNGTTLEWGSGDIITQPSVVGMQQVIYDNYQTGYGQIGDVSGVRPVVIDANQHFVDDGTGNCVLNVVSVDQTALADPAKQPILRSPNGYFVTGFMVENGNESMANYTLEAENTRINVSALTTVDGNADVIMGNSDPNVVASVTRDQDDHVVLDLNGTTDEGDASVLDKLGISATGLTLEPVINEPGKYRSTAPFLGAVIPLSVSGLNEGLTDDTTEESVNVPEKPDITNLAIDCSSTGGFCISNWPTPYPVTFTVSDALNCTANTQVFSGVGTPGSVSLVGLNGEAGSFTWSTGSTAGDTIRLTVDCTGDGGSDSDSVDQYQN